MDNLDILAMVAAMCMIGYMFITNMAITSKIYYNDKTFQEDKYNIDNNLIDDGMSSDIIKHNYSWENSSYNSKTNVTGDTLYSLKDIDTDTTNLDSLSGA